MIGENIKTLRAYLGLSQEDLAHAIGRVTGFIGNVELGRCGVSRDTIDKICKAYDVNEEWLRSGEGSMFTTHRPPVDRENIGTRVKEVRKNNNLTQAQFGEEIGFSKNYIYYVETGKNDPSNDFLRAVSRKFDVSVVWLKTGVDEPDDDLSDVFDWLRDRPDVVAELRERMKGR